MYLSHRPDLTEPINTSFQATKQLPIGTYQHIYKATKMNSNIALTLSTYHISQTD